MEYSNTHPINNDRRLIVGIDFGTTYSGICWAQTERVDRHTSIDDWPSSRTNHGGHSSSKVPTKLRYLRNRQFEWGAQISHDVPAQEVLSLFKLGLEPDKYRNSVDIIGKALTVDDVDQKITDYLSGLFEHFMHVMRQKIGLTSLSSIPLQFVLTVPAIWSDRAKQRTVEAFQRISNLPSGYSTTLLSEPEAAAIAALQELNRHNMNIGDSFLVLDAGGGTVDLITYTITALNPVVEVVEATEGTGDFCGSSRVNDRFIQFITSRLQHEEGWDEDVLHDATKRRFTMSSLAQRETFSVPVPGLGLNRDLGVIRAGRFELRAEDLHMFFEPDIIRIIQLVKEQIALSNASIRSILLVGGYGSSMYLRERLGIAIQEDSSIRENIEILQPPNAWLSVVQGAVMKGLSLAKPENYDIPTVKARAARKHYGYEVSAAYDDNRHATLSSKRYYDGLDGIWRVAVMEWFIKRGELVSEDVPFRKTFSIYHPVSYGRPRTETLRIYADQTSTEAPLSRNNDVQTLCHVTANLDHIPEEALDRRQGVDGRMYYELEFEIEAVYRSAATEYTLIHKGMFS
ncbi:hypothetical protein F5B20DRAFT_569141 [Whalleya microplaca]|nr:hypothetical protein F5B20DRAFT_569141 [Whalleya microplaca]